MNKNPNPISATFGPDVTLTAEKVVDPGASGALRRLGKEVKPDGHSYKGSISIHFYEPALSKEMVVITQFTGEKPGLGLLSSVGMPYALFGISNMTLELRKHAGEISHNSTTNKKDQR